MIVCKGCGDPCRVVTVDFGIGAYEYWGAPGVDVQLARVSECCEADYEDTEEPPEPERYVMETDYYRGVE